MQNQLKSNIWKFYLITSLGVRFITPIRIIYLVSFGLSFVQIGLMELAAAFVIVILEIPTGIFADIVGRKTSRLIAYLLSILAFSCMSFGSTAPIFIFGWGLSGAADAFQSGAQDALIFDTLRELGRDKEYIKIKSHFLLINSASMIIGSILGASLYAIDRRLPWYLITITIVMSTLVFSTVIEPKGLHMYKNFKEQLRKYNESFKLSVSNLRVRYLIVLGLILALPMFVFTTLLNQPYLISRGFNVRSLGIIFAFIIGVSSLIASFSNKIEYVLKKRLSFLLIFASFSILLISIGLIHHPSVLILVIVFYIVDNYKNIILDYYINELINSESRATVLSVQSFFNNTIISLLIVFFGYVADIFTIDIVLISMGIIIGVSGIPFLIILNQIRNKRIRGGTL